MTPRLVYLVARRELLERVRSTSFRATTIALFLLTAALIVGADRAQSLFGDGVQTLAVVESSEPAGLDQALQESANALNVDIKVERYASRESASEAVQSGKADAFLDGENLFFKTEADSSLVAVVNRSLYLNSLPGLLQQLGLTREQAQPLLNPAPASVDVLQPASGKRAGEDDRRVAASVATIGLYLMIALYGNWILTGVVEEKTSRVVEVLLGLLDPADLLAGKTIGIIVSALTQACAALAGLLTGFAIVGSGSLPGIAFDVAAVSVAFLVLGLLLYSLMYAAVGATVGRQDEAQSAGMPVSMFLLAPYMLSLIYVPEQPNSTLSVVLSLLPLTSPLTMPTRVAMGGPSALEVTVALLLLLPAIVAMAWIGGRMYAAAILVNRRTNPLRLLRQVFASR
jgi:ABC-2 type transport system permease protein